MSLILDGGGTIAGLTPGGLPPAVIEQPNMAAGTTTTGPCFSAYQSVAQAIPATTWTKVKLQSKDFDLTNAFDNVTNFRFQPNVAGYYMLHSCISLGTSAYQLATALYKNNATSAYGSNSSAGGGTVGELILLNGTTDYVELYVFTGAALSLGAGPTSTFLQGFLARSA